MIETLGAAPSPPTSGPPSRPADGDVSVILAIADTYRKRLQDTSRSRKRRTDYPRSVPVDPSEALKALETTLTSIEAVLDLPRMNEDLAELEQQASDPELWTDQERAQQVTSRMSHIRADLERVAALRRRLEDAGVMFELAADEHDADTLAEAEADLSKLSGDIASLEVRTLLSGEYDAREALITINAQAGGVDAADWAEMLLRMYGRWAERHNYPLEVYDTSYAE